MCEIIHVMKTRRKMTRKMQKRWSIQSIIKSTVQKRRADIGAGTHGRSKRGNKREPKETITEEPVFMI